MGAIAESVPVLCVRAVAFTCTQTGYFILQQLQLLSSLQRQHHVKGIPVI